MVRLRGLTRVNLDPRVIVHKIATNKRPQLTRWYLLGVSLTQQTALFSYVFELLRRIPTLPSNVGVQIVYLGRFLFRNDANIDAGVWEV